ncbi:hypothetical protein JSO19_00170 [Leucobacter sp. UCMA 4100]|uniref:hypothetical protein n=1 Tax=Leucobacter sp. UCMA 4100 TaxID=2810534 RepID=UPI0022EA18CF|nr:hypothetical protein [Leucobacter sp. UCMA 4100]MDA3145793.1 hypothetical protein [Leucobacter sp. UCMA 4100]
MTTTGEAREWYSQQIEAHPSRFSNEGRDYREWAAKADAREAGPNARTLTVTDDDGKTFTGSTRIEVAALMAEHYYAAEWTENYPVSEDHGAMWDCLEALDILEVA